MAASGDDQAPGRARVVRLRRGATILLCGKCLKRHADGKALRRAVKTEARAAADPASGKVRIVKIGCLGLCPRRAVVVASAAGLARGEVMLVREAGAVADALPRLLRRTAAESVGADVSEIEEA